MLTRFVKLPLHNNVLVGRDLDEIFEPGMIYEVKRYLGEFVITPLGMTSLSEQDANGEIGQIMLNGQYLMTQQELKNE